MCSKCGTVGEPYRYAKRKTVVFRCRACQSNLSLTAIAGTVMQQSHTPLSSMVLGGLLVNDANSWDVGSAVLTAAGIALRDRLSDSAQASRWHGAAGT